ncbi:MAG TPA: DUF6798 domain-containing protein [Kiloniellales bacterium]|nr:DUF6798 domain-containing protein [Kiloniellales bacterium]
MKAAAGQWLVMLAGAALAILLQGVAVPNNANSYHWPIVLDWFASAEGPHDRFTQSLDSYLSHFYTLLRWIAGEATIAPLFYLLHLLTMLAVVAALRCLYALLASADRWRATLAAAATPVVLHGYVVSPLGHGELLLDSLSHSSVIIAIVLWAWALTLQGRPLVAALLLGLGFNVKNFTAAWGGLSLAGPVLLAQPNWRGFGRLALMFLLFASAATPTLLWLAERWDDLGTAAADFDSRDFLRLFYAGHVMVGTHPLPEILAGALFIVAFPPLWLWLRPAAPQAAWRGLLGLWLGSLAVVLLGLVLPLLTGNHMLLNSSPLRIDGFLDWLFFIALGAAVLRQPQWSSLALAAALALMAGRLPAALLLLLWQAKGRSVGPPALALLLAVVVAVTGALPQMQLYDRLGGGLALAALLLALPFLAPSRADSAPRLLLLGALAGLDYAWASGLVEAQPIHAALLVGALALSLTVRPLPRLVAEAGTFLAAGAYGWLIAESDRRVGGLLAAALFGPAMLWWMRQHLALLRRLAPLAAAGVALLLLAQPVYLLAKSGRLDRYGPADVAFLDLQRWARQATPPDSLFLQPDAQLVPNLTPSFWTYARRPAWVDWRQGAAVHWRPDFYPLWRQRMREAVALDDVAAKLAYAKAHAIPYVILAADEALPAGAPAPLYEDRFWRVLPAN